MKRNKQKKMPFATLRKGIVSGLVGLTMMTGAGVLTGCGKDGAPGATGPQGPAGSDGATWYSGIAYSNAQGKVGDFFYDIDDFKIYHKTAEGWEFMSYIRGEDGEDGDDGATWLTGTVVTGSGNSIFATVVGAKVGDMYYNTTTYDVYKCISGNTWKWLANLKGSQGDPGEPGVPGTPGMNGTIWHTGTAISGIGGNIIAIVVDSQIGDLYFNTTTCDVYKCINTNTWEWIVNIQGIPGNPGQNGVLWYSGPEISETQGIAGDYFFDTNDYDIYQKTSDGWVWISNIKGDSGHDGLSAYVGYDGYIWNGNERTEFLATNIALPESVVENTIGIESTMSKYFEGSYIDLSNSMIALMANYKHKEKLTQYSNSGIVEIKVVAERAGTLHIGTANVIDIVNARLKGTSLNSETKAYDVIAGLNTITLDLQVEIDETIVIGGKGSVGLYYVKGITTSDEQGNFSLIDGQSHEAVINSSSNIQDTLAIQVSAGMPSEKSVFNDFENDIFALKQMVDMNTAGLTNSPFAYTDYKKFEGKTLTSMYFPLKNVSAIDDNQIFTIFVGPQTLLTTGGFTSNMEGVTAHRINIPLTSFYDLTDGGTNLFVNSYVEIDLTPYNIYVGEDETLFFADKDVDTVSWGYIGTKSQANSEYTFYNKIRTETPTANQANLVFDIRCRTYIKCNREYWSQHLEFLETLEASTEAKQAYLSEKLQGFNFSILGDSISTYEGISNDSENTNSTIGENLARYDDAATAASGIVGLESSSDTWWMQIVNNCDMNLLVNNSWRGTKVYGELTSNEPGCGTRAENLHDDTGDNAGTEPNIIAVYLGTNDFLKNITIGDFDNIILSDIINDNGSGVFTYSTPTNFAEAYTIMLHKILTKYNSSDVFCFTLSPIAYKVDNTLLESYNAQIRKVATYFELSIVDLYNDSGITSENCSDYLASDKIHPTAQGMDLITECFWNVLYNKYVTSAK